MHAGESKHVWPYADHVDFETDETYPCSAAQLLAALTDQAFVEAKLAATGGGDIVEISPRRVETRREVKVDVPSFATKFLSPVQTITQVEEWNDPAATTPDITGIFTGKAAGAPVVVTGSQRIEGTDSACVLHIKGHIEVKVPFIGGKVAELVRDQVVKNLRREHAFTTAWIAAH
jgi:hypothetical protein